MIIKLPALDQEPPQSGVRLSVAHAAERADVSTRTIKRWIEKAYLPASRNPTAKGKGHLRIRLGDLEALLARGTLR
jgi:predicted site-specific integrase-resolvase